MPTVPVRRHLIYSRAVANPVSSQLQEALLAGRAYAVTTPLHVVLRSDLPPSLRYLLVTGRPTCLPGKAVAALIRHLQPS